MVHAIILLYHTSIKEYFNCDLWSIIYLFFVFFEDKWHGRVNVSVPVKVSLVHYIYRGVRVRFLTLMVLGYIVDQGFLRYMLSHVIA